MPAFYSEGCAQLQALLKKKKMEQKDFAEEAELDAAHLNHIIHGRKRPSLDTASKIETTSKKLGRLITASAWSREAKKPKPVAKRAS